MAQTKVKLISNGVIVQGNLHASHGITTAHIGEGSNLYYTDARVGSYLSSNGYATQSTIVAAITDSAPSTLDTLNELAAALGDDANFSTTVTNNIATKMPLAGGTFTGNVGFNDSTTLSLGASGDLFLIHDATNSIIGNSAGNLIIRNDADDGDIIFQSDNGSGGRDNYLTIDGGVERIFVHKLMRFDDDVQLRLGNNNDIRLYHNSTTGNNNFENHTGGLYVTQYVDDGNIIFRSDDGSGGVAEYIIVNGGAGSVQLKHYGNTKFQTTSTGVEVVTTGINQSSTIRIQGTDGNGNGHPLDLKMNGADDSFSILIGQGGGATPSTVLFNGNRNGNVGIGTTSPSAKLEVRGTAPTYTNSSTVFWGGTTNNDSHNGIMLSSFGDALGGSLASNLLYSNSNTPTQTNTNRSSGQIKFGNTTVASKTSDINFGGYYKGTTTFVERMRINGDGNVGIGTTSPSNKLEVNGGIAITSSGNNRLRFYRGGFFKAGIQVPDTAGQMISGSGVNDLAIRTQSNLLFATGGSAERMRITSGGEVCIGTTSSAPSAQLTIALNDSVGGRLSLSNLRTALFDGDEFGRLSFVSNDATQTGDRARISALCRNTGAATDLAFYTGNTSASVAERMRIESDGTIRAKTGSIVVDTAGQGIYLGGTAVANKLDDYEEGTFTSGVVSSNLTNYSYSGPNGRYTKIGRQVIVTFKISNITATTGQKYIVVNNLPFAQHTASHDEQGFCSNYPDGQRRSGIVINNSSGNNDQWYVSYYNNTAQSGTDAIRVTIIYTTT